MRIDGRLHGNGAQQLQCVVLHHVAQCAGFFIKRTAFFNAEFFRNGDLNVGNVFTAPKRFKQRIAKAQGKQVLHRRLAQVMVDPKNLVFTKNLADTLVDGLVGLEVVAQRFFQNDASFGRVQFGDGELLADRVEQAGCRGQVHHHVLCFAFGQSCRQFGVVVWIGQIYALVAKHGLEPCKFFIIGAFGTLDLLKTRLDERAVLLICHAVAGNANDSAALGQGAVAECLKQGGHQFAPNQVAGAAKKDQIKRHVHLLHKNEFVM